MDRAATNVFEGYKVRLRAFQQSDTTVLWEHYNHDAEAQRLFGALMFPRSQQYFSEFVEKNLKYPTDHDNVHLAIETLDGQLVGEIFSFEAWRRMGCFQLGFQVFRPYWRNGYGGEAVALLLRFFFLELRYHSCSSCCWEFNTASYALHRKLGFRECGRRRQWSFHNGKRYDQILFDMIGSEFEECRVSLPGVPFYVSS